MGLPALPRSEILDGDVFSAWVDPQHSWCKFTLCRIRCLSSIDVLQLRLEYQAKSCLMLDPQSVGSWGQFAVGRTVKELEELRRTSR